MCEKIIKAAWQTRQVRIYAFIFLLIATTLNFYQNSFGISKDSFFKGFQNDSESLVIGKMLNDKFKLNAQTPYGLGGIANFLEFDGDLDTADFSQAEYWVYPSQFGLQGHIFSKIAKPKPDRLNRSINNLKNATAFLSAIAILILSIQFYKIINPLFGISFFISMFFSPWVISFSNNLYWVSFTWFAPAVFAFLMYQNLHSRLKYLYGFLFTLSIFIKALCGYEYLSTIILFSITPFVLSPFFDKKLNYKGVVKYLGIFFVLALVGFLLALCLHAYFRGDGDILAGIASIYKHDVLRRTLGGDVANFHEVYHQSFQASVFEVIRRYIFWNGGLLGQFLSGRLALIILLTLAIFSLFKGRKDAKTFRQNIALLTIFALPALSWFVLGKSHSFIHTHMNYVLWYFGFIAALLYVVFQSILGEIKANLNAKDLAKETK